jgi:DNA-binding XRE family transcriptional regulator
MAKAGSGGLLTKKVKAQPTSKKKRAPSMVEMSKYAKLERELEALRKEHDFLKKFDRFRAQLKAKGSRSSRGSGARHISRRSGQDAVSGRVNHRSRLSEVVMKDYRPAEKRASVSVGVSVRILRELQEMSQNQLAQASGTPQATISAIENDRVRLGVERAKVLARALKCHPVVLVFPGWTHEEAA